MNQIVESKTMKCIENFEYPFYPMNAASKSIVQLTIYESEDDNIVLFTDLGPGTGMSITNGAEIVCNQVFHKYVTKSRVRFFEKYPKDAFYSEITLDFNHATLVGPPRWKYMAAEDFFKLIGADLDKLHYVIALGHSMKHEKYVTLWRPDNKGYCYSRTMAGVYQEPKTGYHDNDDHMPVSITQAESLFRMMPYEGKEMPVIPNTRQTWEKLGVKMTPDGLARLKPQTA